MRYCTFFPFLVLGVAQAQSPSNGVGQIPYWTAPGPNDWRGPCPVLNSLANHGFLPHDGRNFTEDKIVGALTTALNFDTEMAATIFKAGRLVNPQSNATWFDMQQLSVHNVLEKDASLSRSDAYFGSNILFNSSVFAETKKYWTADSLDRNMLTNAQLARKITSRATNPNYTLSALGDTFSFGEIATLPLFFGDGEAVTANRTWIESLFETERLPYELGWARPAVAVSRADFLRVTNVLKNATTLINDDTTASTLQNRGNDTVDAHSGLSPDPEASA